MNDIKQKIIILNLLALLVVAVIVPSVANAKYSLSEIRSNFGSRINFIVNLNDEDVLRGSLLGPMASGIIAQRVIDDNKLSGLLKLLNRLDDIVRNNSNSDELIRDIKNLYSQQARLLEDTSNNILAENTGKDEKSIKNKLAGGAISISRMVNIYKSIAGDFRWVSDSTTHSDLMRVAGNNQVKEFAGETNQIVIYQEKFKPEMYSNTEVVDVINGYKKNDLNIFCNVLIKDDLLELSSIYDLSEDDMAKLKKMAINNLKAVIAGDKTSPIDNFSDVIESVLQESLKSVKNVNSLGEIKRRDDLGFNSCRNGFMWDSEIAVCVQNNCGSIQNASLDIQGVCICDFINESNIVGRACYFPEEYSDCPSCLRACTMPEQDCP